MSPDHLHLERAHAAGRARFDQAVNILKPSGVIALEIANRFGLAARVVDTYPSLGIKGTIVDPSVSIKGSFSQWTEDPDIPGNLIRERRILFISADIIRVYLYATRQIQRKAPDGKITPIGYRGSNIFFDPSRGEETLLFHLKSLGILPSPSKNP